MRAFIALAGAFSLSACSSTGLNPFDREPAQVAVPVEETTAPVAAPQVDDVATIRAELYALLERLDALETSSRAEQHMDRFAGAAPMRPEAGDRPSDDDAIGTSEAEAAELRGLISAAAQTQADAPTESVMRASYMADAQNISTQSVFPALHLASYKRMDMARAGWRTLAAKHPGALGRARPRYEEADLGAKGVFYRLKAGPFPSTAAAQSACEAIKAGGDFCRIVNFDGAALALSGG